MIIYNVTCNVEKHIHEQWLLWVKEHIAQVLSTGCFSEAKLTKVLVDDGHGSITYSVQYRAISREALDSYYTQHANALCQDAIDRFGEKVLSFRTELEIIDEFSVTFN